MQIICCHSRRSRTQNAKGYLDHKTQRLRSMGPPTVSASARPKTFVSDCSCFSLSTTSQRQEHLRVFFVQCCTRLLIDQYDLKRSFVSPHQGHTFLSIVSFVTFFLSSGIVNCIRIVEGTMNFPASYSSPEYSFTIVPARRNPIRIHSSPETSCSSSKYTTTCCSTFQTHPNN